MASSYQHHHYHHHSHPPSSASVQHFRLPPSATLSSSPSLSSSSPARRMTRGSPGGNSNSNSNSHTGTKSVDNKSKSNHGYLHHQQPPITTMTTTTTTTKAPSWMIHSSPRMTAHPPVPPALSISTQFSSVAKRAPQSQSQSPLTTKTIATSTVRNGNGNGNSSPMAAVAHAGTRVWVQVSALEEAAAATAVKPYGRNLLLHNNLNNNNNHVALTTGKPSSAAVAPGTARGDRRWSSSSSLSVADTESVTDSSSGSGRRSRTWGWKVGILVERERGLSATGSRMGSPPCLTVQLLDDEDDCMEDEDALMMTTMTMTTRTQHHSMRGSASAAPPTIITLPADAMKNGQVVLANELRVDPDTGFLQVPADLIALTHLHEPAVVESLRVRFQQDAIYTNTGAVLLALNPFQTVRGMYGEAIQKRYWEKAERQLQQELPPHVYAIADQAFRSMMRSLEDSLLQQQQQQQPLHAATTPNKKFVKSSNSSIGSDHSTITATTVNKPIAAVNNINNKVHQSILVSGESGAGKTVTTKFVMKYLAALSQRSVHLARHDARAYIKAAAAAPVSSSSLLSLVAEPTAASLSSPHRNNSKQKQPGRNYLPTPMRKGRNTGGGSAVTNKMQQQQQQPTSAAIATSSWRHSRSAAVASSSSSSSMSPHTSNSNNNNNTNTNNSRHSDLNSASLLAGVSSNSIEAQVLQSNPILESFGNARTVRNDNSSRFGKFIEIQFTASGRLVGAQIETYLLEKVRLIRQAAGERNYHVFYELLSGALDSRQLKLYCLQPTATVQDFLLTAGSGTYDRRDGVTDHETLGELLQALHTMGFSADDITQVLAVVAAILHAGNLTLLEQTAVASSSSAAGSSAAQQYSQQQQHHHHDGSVLDTRNVHLQPVCHLLGVTVEALQAALCQFTIQAGKQQVSVTRNNTKAQAERGLDALLKETYGALFAYLVMRINDSIACNEPTLDDNNDEDHNDDHDRRGSAAATHHRTKIAPAATIGVLDIFGFESFTKNSFEQLCINYCNEALQQQFNAFVLKNEQAVYEKEGIEWSFIEFPENQDVLDLMEKRGVGLLSLLDDQCRAPGPSDKAFCLNIYNKCAALPRFMATRKQMARQQFAVHHYAGPVEYSTDGFIEKNRDELPKEAVDLLKSSIHPFIQQLAIMMESNHRPRDQQHNDDDVTAGLVSDGMRPRILHRADSSVGRATVGGQFRQQLRHLRHKIDLTAPHYIRCLKPNDLLIPDHFDPGVVAEQLRCGGILEAVRVARAGFTQHYPHGDFIRRYRSLAWRELALRNINVASSSSTTSTTTTTPSRFSSSLYRAPPNYTGQSPEPATKKMSDNKSPAELKTDCKELVKILYRKILALQEREAGDTDDDPYAPSSDDGKLLPMPETPSPPVKAKTYTFETVSATPPWAAAISSSVENQPTTPNRRGNSIGPYQQHPNSPSTLLPPMYNNISSSSIHDKVPRSLERPSYRNEVVVTSSRRDSSTSTPASTWKRGSGGTIDYAKVGIQIGKTKVFLRYKAFEALERIRSREQSQAATKLNSLFRRYLARLAYVPYRDAFRQELYERRRLFEQGLYGDDDDEFKETKEPDDSDHHSMSFRGFRGGLLPTSSTFGAAATSSYLASASLVDKWMESKVRDAIHNPVPRHEWGKQVSSRQYSFKWVLREGIWVQNYQPNDDNDDDNYDDENDSSM